IHGLGQEAKLVLENSREIVASLIKTKPSEIFFTGSATESNNTVLKGVKGHIIISAIEHPCIMETAEWLENQGLEITRIKVDKDGLINPLDIKKAIKKETVLVSIIHASNEIGTIQDIQKIGQICKEVGVLFHTDASQSFGKIPIDIKNIDLLTASSHKMYGPKGVALLYKKEGVNLNQLLHGGGQENGLRSSTVNVPAIVGFAKACEIAQKEMKEESQRLTKLRNKLIKSVSKIKNSYLTGHPSKRLPNSASFRFDFVEGESVAIMLDLKGIAISTGSACSSIKLEPSYVLMALGLKHEQAHGSIRISLGKETTEKEIDYLIKVLPDVINKLREISPFK
ncbi:cysteine desulfurase, partial [Patescibacteria group bacterium]|nr:cysteine desulfurase [Patescibacteria group bacterium]